MFNSLVLMICCAVFGADKVEKQQTPKQQREAAEKAIKAKIDPIEKDLAKAQKRLGFAKAARVTGMATEVSQVDDLQVIVVYRLQADKQKDIDRYAKEVADITAKLKPLQDELKALKKTPLPKPEPKPDPK